MSQKELTWSNILSLASRYDVQEGQFHSKVDNDTSVWFTEGLSNYNKSVMESQRSRSFMPSHNRSKPCAAKPFYTQRSQSVDRRDLCRPSHSSNAPRSKSVARGRNNIICFYCKKVGHVKAECRRFLKLCLVCGSSQHQISTCPERHTHNTRQSHRSNMPESFDCDRKQVPLNQ